MNRLRLYRIALRIGCLFAAGLSPAALLAQDEAPADAGDLSAVAEPSMAPVVDDALAASAEEPFFARFKTAASYLESLDLSPKGVLDRGDESDDEMLAGETLSYALRVLYQLNRLSDERLVVWSRIERSGQDPVPAELPSLATVHWHGVVEKVEAFAVPEDLYLEMDRVFVLHVRESSARGTNWRILVKSVPDVWLQQPPNARASGYALFLLQAQSERGGTSEDDGVVAWAVGDVPTWRPTEPDERLGVTPSLTSLAEAGVNLLSIDGLRQRNKSKFQPEDNEPFYAFLRATEETTADERRTFARDATLVDLLTDADAYVGQAVRFPGRVRRITQIRVDDSRAARLLGRENYWQLDLVYDLEGQPIRMKGRDGEDIVFHSTFPATVCTLDLPPELEAARQASRDRGEGGSINRQVAVEGYFFRLWAFPTEQTRKQDLEALQFGPLTIGTIDTVEPAEFEAGWLWWLTVPGVLLVGFLLVYLWRTSRGDSINDRVRMQRLRRDADKLNSLEGVEGRTGGPDFSGIRQKSDSSRKETDEP